MCESESIIQRILIFSKWRQMISFALPLFPQKKGPKYPSERKLGGPQCRCRIVHYLLSYSDGAGYCSVNSVDSNSVLRVVCRMISRNTTNNTERGPRIVNRSQSSFAFFSRERAQPSDYSSTQAAKQMLSDPCFHSFCCYVNTSMSYYHPL